LWRRVMDPRLLEHHGGDIRLAALDPHPPGVNPRTFR
jgi:hypothetical protein